MNFPQPKSWLEGGIVLLDEAGRILDTNEAFCNWIAQSRTTLLGVSFFDLICGSIPEWNDAFQSLKEKHAHLFPSVVEDQLLPAFPMF